MSSLAAARADGYYFPPDWDPSKGTSSGASAKYKGNQGSLGRRANKIDEGILVVRFEAPYHFWCSGCNQKVGQGVRFNAEKKQIGNYHSTKIWSFTSVTRCCANVVEFHTDPKSCEYILVKGGVRKVEEYSAEEAGTQELAGREDRLKLAEDPFYALEHKGAQEQRAKQQKPALEALYDDSTFKTTEHYSLNKALRRQMRAQKAESKKLEEEGRAMGLPEHIPLLPSSSEDTAGAAAAALASRGTGSGFKDNLKLKRALIRGSSIFSTPEQRTAPRGALLHTPQASASAPTSRASTPASSGIKRTISGSAVRAARGGSTSYASVLKSDTGSKAGSGSSLDRKLQALVKRRKIEMGMSK